MVMNDEQRVVGILLLSVKNYWTMMSAANTWHGRAGDRELRYGRVVDYGVVSILRAGLALELMQWCSRICL